MAEARKGGRSFRRRVSRPGGAVLVTGWASARFTEPSDSAGALGQGGAARMPDEQGESPPGSFDKVRFEVRFAPGRTGGRESFGFPVRWGGGKELASTRCRTIGFRSGRARIGARFDPRRGEGKELASTRAERRSRRVSARCVGGANRRTWLRRNAWRRIPGSDSAGQEMGPASSRAWEPRGFGSEEPDGPVEACFRRFRTRNRPGLRPGRDLARKRDEPGLVRNREAQSGAASRPGDGSPDWDSGGRWRHRPPLAMRAAQTVFLMRSITLRRELAPNPSQPMPISFLADPHVRRRTGTASAGLRSHADGGFRNGRRESD